MLQKMLLVLMLFGTIAGSKQSFGQESQTPKPGDIKIEKRPFRMWGGATGEYELGTFYVLENRDDPNSRVISIGFSRFRAHNPSGPPVFFLPGGPGNSYLEKANAEDPQLKKTPFYVGLLTQSCDVVCVDQRGYSERGEILQGVFRGDEPTINQSLEDRVRDYVKSAQAIVQQYQSTETDLRGYTVLECVADVNELRSALGYDKISLRGQSFGSQWSFAIMRKHPDIVERALLSGVEPLNNGYDRPSDVFAAVKRIWKQIDEDPRFKPYLPSGGMVEAAKTVITRLEKDPIEVETKGFLGIGKPRVVRELGPDDFPWQEPAAILEMYHGHYDRWAAPRPRAWGRGRLIQPLIDTSLGITPDRREQLWNDPAVRYLSRANFAAMLASADVWPSLDVGDEFRKPVRCEIPVVLVNGDWDTNTPIENAYEIAPFFPNRHILTVHQAGHGTIGAAMYQQHPKVFQALMRFLCTGETEGIPDEIDFAPYREFDPPSFKLPSDED